MTHSLLHSKGIGLGSLFSGLLIEDWATSLLVVVSRIELCLIHALGLKLMATLVEVGWADWLHHLRVRTLDEGVRIGSVTKEAVHWYHHHISFFVVLKDGHLKRSLGFTWAITDFLQVFIGCFMGELHFP